MKIVKIAGYYKYFFLYYQQRFPEIAKNKYVVQHKHLMSQYIGWSNFYSKAFDSLGHESFEIVWNAENMQKKWAEENGISGSYSQIILEQIKQYKPDLVWFQDSFSFDIDFLKNLKKKIPSIKLLVGNSCSPYNDNMLEKMRIFDFITTCSPQFVSEFKEHGIESLLLYHAFEPSIIKKFEPEKRDTDFIFVGSIIPRKNFHLKRKIFLEKIAKEPEIDFRFYGNISSNKNSEILKQQILFLTKEFFIKLGLKNVFINTNFFRKAFNLESYPQRLKFSKELKKCYQGELYGKQMFENLYNSKITIDAQPDINQEYSANMRLFESTGIGNCLLVEYKKNIPDLFVPEKEVVIYKTFDEAVEKIKWLLKNPEKLKEIAKAGQKRTFESHNYLNRAKIFIDYVNTKI